MNNITIKAPTTIKYIKDIPTIKDVYNNDLPHNAVIDKQVTGCGGTTLVLTNDQPYIVAVHLIKMIENKVRQHTGILAITGSTTNKEISTYLKNTTVPKIMITYDSLPRLIDMLGFEAKNFRLLVDEVHCLIGYLDNFKPTVAIKLIDGMRETFKSVSYLTATPTNPKYLPKPLQQLDQVKIEWEDAVYPDLDHAFSKETLSGDVLATVLDKLDNSTDELFVFYNSKRGVSTLIKSLLKLKPNLSLDDMNILFSDTDDNTTYFKKYLGSKFKYGEFPDGTNNKRLNFISSMGFEGCDFYPNQDTSINPTSIVVSNPKIKSMRFDIKVQLKQICGRIRGAQENKIIYLWTTLDEDIEHTLTEDQYLYAVTKSRTQSIDALALGESNDVQAHILKTVAKLGHDHIILDGSTAIIHPYSVEALMSNYHAMHSDSLVLNNTGNNNVIGNKLAELNPNNCTFSVPKLNPEYTKALGRTPSVRSLITHYESILDSARENPNYRQDIETFLINNPLFSEWLDAGVTISNMRSLKENRTKINEYALSLKIKDTVEAPKFEIGNFYTAKEIKEILKAYYAKHGIVESAKATSITRWYDVKLTKLNNKDAYKILNIK